MDFMANNNDLILAYPSMREVTLTQPVNVMLAPQFYTFKQEILPIRYGYQAKKIAPSIFDGLLQEGSYEYMVWKEGETWSFLAYDMGRIRTFLESKGFDLQYVSKLFFAQQSVSLFDAPLALGEKEALVVLDDKVVVVPSGSLPKNPSLVFDNRFTPKKGIVLSTAYGSFLSPKQTISFASVFAAFGLIFFVEGGRLGSNEASATQLEALLAQQPSLQSQYARESVKEKYKTIDTTERQKRELIKTVSGLIFKGTTLVSLEMNEKKYQVEFVCDDAQTATKLKGLVSKTTLKSVHVSDPLALKMEGSL